MSDRLDSKIALVTGGASGIGLACVKVLADAGATRDSRRVDWSRDDATDLALDGGDGLAVRFDDQGGTLPAVLADGAWTSALCPDADEGEIAFGRDDDVAQRSAEVSAGLARLKATFPDVSIPVTGDQLSSFCFLNALLLLLGAVNLRRRRVGS